MFVRKLDQMVNLDNISSMGVSGWKIRFIFETGEYNEFTFADYFSAGEAFDDIEAALINDSLFLDLSHKHMVKKDAAK